MPCDRRVGHIINVGDAGLALLYSVDSIKMWQPFLYVISFCH